MTAFTIPYFSLTERPPSSDQAPLAPSGIFAFDANGERYIREQKFSVSWSSGSTPEEPSLMVALNPLSEWWEYRDDQDHEIGQFPAVAWVRNNLFHIANEWEGLLDWLDEQTTLPVWWLSLDRLGFSWNISPIANRRPKLHYFRQRNATWHPVRGPEF